MGMTIGKCISERVDIDADMIDPLMNTGIRLKSWELVLNNLKLSPIYVPHFAKMPSVAVTFLRVEASGRD
jgi:hypothetical protein